MPQEIEHEDPSAPFLPNFTCPDGQPIKATNSLDDSPLLAMTLLKGVALPKDLSRLPKKMVDNVAEMCFYTAKVRETHPRAFLLGTRLASIMPRSLVLATSESHRRFWKLNY